MRKLEKEDDIKITQILKDHWNEFIKIKLHRAPVDMRGSVVEAVEKALSCGDINKGYIKLLTP